MIDKIMIVTTLSALTLSATAFAQGTADEAKAMLMKAVAAVKADKAKAPVQQGRRWVPGRRPLSILLQY